MLLADVIEHCGNLLGFRHVRGEVVAANFSSDSLRIFLVPGMHNDLRALSGKSTSDAQSNVMRRSGNQCNFVLQQHKSFPFEKGGIPKLPQTS